MHPMTFNIAVRLLEPTDSIVHKQCCEVTCA